MKEPLLPQSEAESVAYRITHGVMELANSLERDAAKAVDDLQISRPLAKALWQLDPRQGPYSRRSLAARLMCDPSNVTFLADRLEERGLVERASDPNDRRVKALQLTPAGVEMRSRLVAAAVGCPTFARLSPKQRRQLSDLLGQALGEGSVSG